MSYVTESLTERLFHEDELYAYIEDYAQRMQMQQTLRALSFAKKCHEGQVRKGIEKIPYIYHPLMVACQAISLGLDEDYLVAAALLHDVCEDCQVALEELPVQEEARQVVALLTKDKNFCHDREAAYYAAISNSGAAVMIKLMDRCNNVSGMTAGFGREKLISYLQETEQWYYPLMDEAKKRYPQYTKQIFLIRYHISSILETIKRQL